MYLSNKGDLGFPGSFTRIPPRRCLEGRAPEWRPPSFLLVRHLAGELDQLLTALYVTGEVVPDRLGGLLPRREGLVVHRHDVHARLLELLVDADVVLLRGGIGVL